MILVRAPLRVSFCGGGSDVPAYYLKYGGCVISTSIKQYIFLSANKCFYEDKILLKYSITECVNTPEQIQHKIFKTVLSDFKVKGIEISSIADVPSGTGLGSSSSFSCALIKLIEEYKGTAIDKPTLAEMACELEINKLKAPIGKQDQYACAYGGLNFIEFNKNGTIDVTPLNISEEMLKKLQNKLMLFYTGIEHDANKILSDQNNSLISNEDKIANLSKIVQLTRQLKSELEAGHLEYLGKCLNENWNIKKKMSNLISNRKINEIYEKAINAGAVGGKLLGAGGGGFLLFYVNEDKQKNVREALKNYQEIKFEIDQEGAKVLYHE